MSTSIFVVAWRCCRNHILACLAASHDRASDVSAKQETPANASMHDGMEAGSNASMHV